MHRLLNAARLLARNKVAPFCSRMCGRMHALSFTIETFPCVRVSNQGCAPPNKMTPQKCEETVMMKDGEHHTLNKRALFGALSSKRYDMPQTRRAPAFAGSLEVPEILHT